MITIVWSSMLFVATSICTAPDANSSEGGDVREGIYIYIYIYTYTYTHTYIHTHIIIIIITTILWKKKVGFLSVHFDITTMSNR